MSLVISHWSLVISHHGEASLQRVLNGVPRMSVAAVPGDQSPMTNDHRTNDQGNATRLQHQCVSPVPVRRGGRADRRARLRGSRAARRRAPRLAGRVARRPEAGDPPVDGANGPVVLEHQRVHDERGQRLPAAVLVSVVHRARRALPACPDRSHPQGLEPLRRVGRAAHHDRARRPARARARRAARRSTCSSRSSSPWPSTPTTWACCS